ncbi:MAG: hypothetical protein V8R91_13305 [Butyricimonas faecihominis]
MKNSWYGTTTAGTLGVNRAEDKTFAYDSVYKWNESSQTGSVMAMSMSKNEHNWFGLISTYTTKLGQSF